ncbi:(2Fe-2S)-binding protein [bacterium]|nr:(2Fe-2S)-binding protein [bacterium]
MPKCTIDGKSIEFQPGTNLIEVARTAGIDIPFYCYHPAMSVVAQCRMCAVEIEGMPKLQTACSTVATDGMVVKTTSDRAKSNQKSVMEFLLINHPLDCSICDKSGECDLQDFSYTYGSDKMRYEEQRRTFVDEDMGPMIKKNMNRCIHCTRCIRFGAEIVKKPEIVAVQRGNHTEIVTVDNKPLTTEYAGNYADICPTGSLTIKDFRFKKRVWFLKKTASVCEGCSTGCNMDLSAEKGTLYRCNPRENMEINKYWLCDEGRFNFHYVNDPKRTAVPVARSAGQMQEVTWAAAVQKAQSVAQGKKAQVLVGSDLTQEEAQAIVAFGKALNAPVSHFGTAGVKTTADDTAIDSLLRRKSKTSNLHGMEKLGIAPFAGGSADVTFVFRGGRAQLPELKGSAIGVGVFFADDLKAFDVVLPGLSFAEKDGTIVNFQGKEQRLKAAIPPVGISKPLKEILTLWEGARA